MHNRKKKFSSVRDTDRRFYEWNDTTSEVTTDEKEKEQTKEQRHTAKLITVEAGYRHMVFSLCSFVYLF